LAELPLADRATIANMAPEYGATCGIFPVDAETLRYMRTTNRPESLVALVEAYYKEQGMFLTAATPPATYSDTLELDLSTVMPCLAGPSRPQDRVRLDEVAQSFRDAMPSLMVKSKTTPLAVTDPNVVAVPAPESTGDLVHGSVVIASITSCTNTSNPYVMMAAGLLARNAVNKGLEVKPWVKTSLAPGSKVVTEYFNAAGLTEYLDKLKFNLVGYGCATCIGNSGPLAASISKEIEAGKLVVASVLSGNRNFEGRVHPEVRANYLASPPLVVAYALAGRIDIDFQSEPIGTTPEGESVFLKDVWPSFADIKNTVDNSVLRSQFEHIYADVFLGDDTWKSLVVPEGNLYAWDEASTYVKNPPYFDGMTIEPIPVTDIVNARALALLGDSITTDHISPAGNIKATSPAGQYLQSKGINKEDFNSYGARRGNHEVVVRGTFANVRLKNLLAPGTEGGVTRHFPDGTEMSIYDASMKYQAEQVPLIILAGKEYGSGSSRDWAAKGTRLLGVRSVIAESYERIHRSNLVGMGVLPLQFKAGETVLTVGVTGQELFTIDGLAAGLANGFADGRELAVRATKDDGSSIVFHAIVRIDTPQEVLYYQHGGILPYVLRQLLKSE